MKRLICTLLALVIMVFCFAEPSLAKSHEFIVALYYRDFCSSEEGVIECCGNLKVSSEDGANLEFKPAWSEEDYGWDIKLEGGRIVSGDTIVDDRQLNMESCVWRYTVKGDEEEALNSKDGLMAEVNPTAIYFEFDLFLIDQYGRLIRHLTDSRNRYGEFEYTLTDWEDKLDSCSVANIKVTKDGLEPNSVYLDVVLATESEERYNICLTYLSDGEEIFLSEEFVNSRDTVQIGVEIPEGGSEYKMIDLSSYQDDIRVWADGKGNLLVEEVAPSAE